jgi:myo-inositol-1(or 4)-monophosphatase
MVDDVVNAWDVAPFAPIIAESGGVFSSWRGERTVFGGDLIATNAGVAEAARALLLDPGA